MMLLLRFKYVRLFMLPISRGMEPLNWFELRYKPIKLWRSMKMRRAEAISPVSLLFSRTNT